jgi:hypothetical protein
MCNQPKSLNVLLNELDKYNIQLRGLYTSLKQRLKQIIFIEIISLVTLCYFSTFRFKITYENSDLSDFSLILLTAIVILYAINKLLARKLHVLRKSFTAEYEKAFTICNQIVDTTDWTSFRKRELENNTKSRALQIVESFYELRTKRLAPIPTASSIYNKVYLAHVIMSLFIMAGICLIMAHTILADFSIL